MAKIFGNKGWKTPTNWTPPSAAQPKPQPAPVADGKENKKERKPRMRAAAYVFSSEYLYRRAYSELTMLDLLDGVELSPGMVINFITGGNIDQMTYLKLMIRRLGHLSHVIVSTWCMSADDALQLIQWMEGGTIDVLDLYVGEIFKGSYGAVWNQLHDFYTEHPEHGRICIFRNHSKIIAGTNGEHSFYVQTSANMDTNPRAEQGCIQIGDEPYRWVRDYFSGIITFEKEDRDNGGKP